MPWHLYPPVTERKARASPRDSHSDPEWGEGKGPHASGSVISFACPPALQREVRPGGSLLSWELW